MQPRSSVAACRSAPHTSESPGYASVTSDARRRQRGDPRHRYILRLTSTARLLHPVPRELHVKPDLPRFYGDPFSPASATTNVGELAPPSPAAPTVRPDGTTLTTLAVAVNCHRRRYDLRAQPDFNVRLSAHPVCADGVWQPAPSSGTDLEGKPHPPGYRGAVSSPPPRGNFLRSIQFLVLSR